MIRAALRAVVSAVLLAALPAAAQHPDVFGNVPDVPEGPGAIRGRVVHTARPNAVGDLAVVLYALPDSGSPGLRAGRTGADGSFAFEGVPVDPGITYLVGARYAGVAFGTRAAFAPGASVLDVEVSISEPSAEAVGIVIGSAQIRIERGCSSLVVDETHNLENTTEGVLFVPAEERGSRAPLWETLLPPEAADFESGLGAFDTGLERDGRSVRFFGPLYPGERALNFSWSLPGGAEAARFARGFPVGAPRVEVATDARGARLTGASWRSGDPVTLLGRPHRVVFAEDLAPGAELSFAIESTGARDESPAPSLHAARFRLELDDAVLSVDEHYTLRVDGSEPLVATTDTPLLCLPLPRGAHALRFADASMAIGLAREPDGGLAIRGPLPPGESTLALGYALPVDGDRTSFTRTFLHNLPVVRILVADTGVVATSEQMHRRRPVRTADRSYIQLEAFGVEAGDALTVDMRRVTAARRLPRMAVGGLVFLVAGFSAWFLSAPLRHGGRSEEVAAGESPAEVERGAIYAALRDLEDDFETGKISAEDHAELRRELRARAGALIEAERQRPPAAVPEPVVCVACATPLPEGARFCPGCGAQLVAARERGDGPPG